jgi:sigma-E factor negative regulatory protein RseB
MARVIGIEPRDQLRYGYRVWIDEATAMPLRMQLRDAHGYTLEQIVFTDLVLPAHISPMELVPTVDAHNYRWVQQDVPAPAGHSHSALAISWQASSLPPGFRMTASARQMLPGGPAEHLVFSDGLASVSVFVQVRGNAGGDAGGSAHDDTASLGTSSAYSTAVQGYRITVVGEVPPQTVRDIARAMRAAVPPAAMAESSLGVPDPRGIGQHPEGTDLARPGGGRNGFAATNGLGRLEFGSAAPAGAHFSAGPEHRR